MIPPNTLIPIDDLHWDEEDGKYIVLNEEEIQKILTSLFRDGWPDDEASTEKSMKVLEWATYVRSGQLLLNGIVSGRIDINLEDGEDDPRFIERKRTEDDPT